MRVVRNALRLQERLHRLRATLAQRDVVVAGAALVGVALNFNAGRGNCFSQAICEASERTVVIVQIVLVVVEINAIRGLGGEVAFRASSRARRRAAGWAAVSVSAAPRGGVSATTAGGGVGSGGGLEAQAVASDCRSGEQLKG